MFHCFQCNLDYPLCPSIARRELHFGKMGGGQINVMCPRCWWDAALKGESTKQARFAGKAGQLTRDERIAKINDVNANIGSYEVCGECPIGAWCMTSFMKSS